MKIINKFIIRKEYRENYYETIILSTVGFLVGGILGGNTSIQSLLLIYVLMQIPLYFAVLATQEFINRK